MKAAFEKQDQFLVKGRREVGFRSWLPSFHTHAELVYVIKGTIRTTVDGQKHTLREGELSVIFPYVPHAYEEVPDAEALVLMVEPKAVVYETVLHTMLPERHYIDGRAFFPLLSRAVELIQLGKVEAAQGYVTAVLGEFLERVPLKPADSCSTDIAVRILDYCMEHFNRDITMRDVSEALYLSQSQVSKIFSHKIKYNFREYINLLRIDKAKELLADPEQKILDIMCACGFHNQSSFNRVFREYCGVCPREYRRNTGFVSDTATMPIMHDSTGSVFMENKANQNIWKNHIPVPVLEAHPEFYELYQTAWELAYDHVKDIPGMPQNPYMDEAFCATQIWIWDTCFMSLFCKYAREVFPGVESLNNFYEVLHGNKRLPKILTPEDEPYWTLAVPGELFEMKIHIADNPPLFAWAEYENALMGGDKDYIRTLLYEKQFLQKHYHWLEGLKGEQWLDTVRCRTFWNAEDVGYKWEGGRSGMDNTPRGRVGEHTVGQRPNNPDMLWLDAICQQALSAKMISKLFTIVEDSENARVWEEKYEEKKRLVNELYWDEIDGFYYDIDCNSHDFYKIMTIASYWTLLSEIAPRERAEALVAKLVDPEIFSGFTSFLSLSRKDNDYSPQGGYWRGAMWLPTAYMTLRGLVSYGYFDVAREEALKLLTHMYKTYAEFTPHTIWECYSPEENKPACNEEAEDQLVRKDFCGWSALGPIAVYIESVLGFHTIDAFSRTVQWARPKDFQGKYGIRNLHFGDVHTDIVAEGQQCCVISDGCYILEIDGKAYQIQPGETKIQF